MKVGIFVLVALMILLSGCSFSLDPIDKNKTIFKDYSISDIPIVGNNIDGSRNASVSVADKYNMPKEVNNDDYLIGAFNIQIFGEKKANSNVMPVIEDILDDYDIIAIQEVRDLSGTVIAKLNDIPGYDLRASPRLGRSTSKEQYIFLFSNRVIPGKSSVYSDEDDLFEREPFCMDFVIDSQDMVFCVVHVKPSDADQEIRLLTNVVDWVDVEFGEDKNVYIMGDLNGDCVYFNNFEVLDDFQVLIDENVDTTVGITDCAYDRILADEVDSKVLQVGVDNLINETGGDMELMEAVSDHYPIYMIYDRT